MGLHACRWAGSFPSKITEPLNYAKTTAHYSVASRAIIATAPIFATSIPDKYRSCAYHRRDERVDSPATWERWYARYYDETFYQVQDPRNEIKVPGEGGNICQSVPVAEDLPRNNIILKITQIMDGQLHPISLIRWFLAWWPQTIRLLNQEKIKNHKHQPQDLNTLDFQTIKLTCYAKVIEECGDE